MLEGINSILSGIFVPILLCTSGIYFSVKLKFFYLLHPIRTLRAMCGGSGGGVSSAGAVTLALAGTLGVGNIVGVASAIHLGGFGAVFWIWVSALLAMVLKYAEIVLAMAHRRGTADGCAMYYILDFFRKIGLCRLGRIVAAVFALSFLVCSLTMGSMLQSGAAAEAVAAVSDMPKWLTGIILGGLTLFCASRDASGLIKITSVLVPLMSIGYTVLALAVIISNRGEVGDAFRAIFSSAFCARGVFAGTGGFVFMRAVRYGVMRGLVSNEAGCGTAPTAHAAAECASPSRQGLWGIFEVFADTVLLCTLTALVIILEYDAAVLHAGNYMEMSIAAFSAVLGKYAGYFLAIAVLCFAFATVLCWVHYGKSAARYLLGERTSKKVFIPIYAACVCLGGIVSPDICWQLSDLSMGVMTVINLSVLWGMRGEVISSK